jgi:hypothetical protein
MNFRIKMAQVPGKSANRPSRVVQRQLRHKDARTTLQKYGHVIGDSQRRAVETLSAKIERHTAIELVPSAELVPISMKVFCLL